MIALAEKARLEALGVPRIPGDKALIAVDDTLKALQALAGAWIRKYRPFVVGITGSSGKPRPRI